MTAKLALTLTVALALTSACTETEPQTAPTTQTTTTTVAETTTTTEPTTTTTTKVATTVEPFPDERLRLSEPGTPEAEVEAAWRQALDGYFAAISDPPNPEHPDFVRWYADPALSDIQGDIEVLVENGWAGREGAVASFEYPLRIEIAEDGRTAELMYCSFDAGEIFVIETGEVINDLIMTSEVLTELELIDGRWKRVRSNPLTRVEGVGPCAGNV